MIMSYSRKDLTGKELERFGIARARDAAYQAVMKLWRQRKAKDNLTQKKLAESIGRDPAWVSRRFRGPGNWTIQTLGAFAQALNGELEIRIVPLEKASDTNSNSDAYSGYDEAAERTEWSRRAQASSDQGGPADNLSALKKDSGNKLEKQYVLEGA